MKTVLSAFLVLISTSAFANPFDAFEGSYVPAGTPQVSGDNAKECDWMNFKEMTGVKFVKASDGSYKFTLTSVSNNSPVSTGWQFKEFSNSSPTGATDSGVISGDSQSAQYRQTTSASDFQEAYTFSIVKAQNGSYGFSMAYQDNEQFSGAYACYYNVELSKQ